LGRKPKSNISLYQAKDSCVIVGKTLCTTKEWTFACQGGKNRNYPYGNKYEPMACNTRDTTVYKSGSFPECRGYFEVYDMSGNLAEWTDTRSSKNSDFYNVMGGFWKSGSQSSCTKARYSYYPQNYHNPVGFRCCKELQVVK
jgi:formylglycine-generating enzyme required for sulfatase activity